MFDLAAFLMRAEGIVEEMVFFRAFFFSI